MYLFRGISFLIEKIISKIDAYHNILNLTLCKKIIHNIIF